jgi:CBS domain-containing protein
MSPRAAWRLESLGFTDVYDFAAGKAAWLAAGLPIEGTNATTARAGEHAHRDVPTCHLDEPLANVRERVRAAGWDTCIVVNQQRIVLGRLGRNTLATDDDQTVEDALCAGPSTIRPDTPLDAIVERLHEKNLTSALVTTLEGELIGVLRLEDAAGRVQTVLV